MMLCQATWAPHLGHASGLDYCVDAWRLRQQQGIFGHDVAAAPQGVFGLPDVVGDANVAVRHTQCCQCLERPLDVQVGNRVGFHARHLVGDVHHAGTFLAAADEPDANGFAGCFSLYANDRAVA